MPELKGERVTLRPATGEDAEAVLAIVTSETAREWWMSPNTPDEMQAEIEDVDFPFLIESDGELAGFLQVTEEAEPDYRHAAIDIALAEGFQRKGLGPDALRTLIRWLVDERGHHRITIDPAAHNENAVSAYRSVGFKPVGVMREYERGRDGTWRDSLLMDLLAEELR